MVKKIISGGQTGVDRAALDVAIKYHISHGGFCPKGRKAEDGKIPSCYQLQETKSDDYSERTILNIDNSDGTLILVTEIPVSVRDGTILTIKEVIKKNKPYLVINVCDLISVELAAKWLLDNHIKILNIAGPRESSRPGIYQSSVIFIENLLSKIEIMNI